MKLRNSTLDKFLQEIEGKQVYCFGASIMPQEICEEYEEICFEEKIKAFVDNDSKKVGTEYKLLQKGIPIFSVEEMVNRITEEDILVITSKYYVEIYEDAEQYQPFASDIQTRKGNSRRPAKLSLRVRAFDMP